MPPSPASRGAPPFGTPGRLARPLTREKGMDIPRRRVWQTCTCRGSTSRKLLGDGPLLPSSSARCEPFASATRGADRLVTRTGSNSISPRPGLRRALAVAEPHGSMRSRRSYGRPGDRERHVVRRHRRGRVTASSSRTATSTPLPHASPTWRLAARSGPTAYPRRRSRAPDSASTRQRTSPRCESCWRRLRAPPVSVAVIVPTCDRPGALERCLAAVADQSQGDLEVIVVDDGRRVPAHVPRPIRLVQGSRLGRRRRKRRDPGR